MPPQRGKPSGEFPVVLATAEKQHHLTLQYSFRLPDPSHNEAPLPPAVAWQDEILGPHLPPVADERFSVPLVRAAHATRGATKVRVWSSPGERFKASPARWEELPTEIVADRDSLPVLAEIKGHATHSQEPQWFTTAPIPAIRKLLDKVGWSVGDVDLFEINEAFAVVAMAAQKDLGIPREKLNVNGGACALGHPIGATGARLIVTLLHALEAQNLKRGVAALCIGGGEATAIAIERVVRR